ncbi:DUF2007 domain-containing protein [Candidatus Kapabacteria bacterium]|nr:DUF2007 domain-containing protein [Candidatus Kapabacteria bacterium]
MSNPQKDINWILVYTTNTMLEANMLKANLSGANIPCEILSQVDTTRMFSVGELAIVKLFVPSDNKEEATLIINDIINNND